LNRHCVRRTQICVWWAQRCAIQAQGRPARGRPGWSGAGRRVAGL